MNAAARAQAIGRWAEIEVSPSALGQLERFEDWLRDEAIPAGGLGPNEADRLWNRHILDSCLFAAFTSNADSVVDVGSGVGLPGIPLAIIRRDLAVTLVDKSQRRSDLARRAVRILGVDNVEVVNSAVEAYRGRHDVLVSRAALPPEALVAAGKRLGARRVVVSASRVAPPSVPGGWELREIPEHLLGERAWMMEAWISAGESG